MHLTVDLARLVFYCLGGLLPLTSRLTQYPLVNELYIYHRILNHAIEHYGKPVKPYEDIVKNDPKIELSPRDIGPIIDKLELDGLINTIKGYGLEYKRILANQRTKQFMSSGGYITSERQIMHEILRFLAEEINRFPNKQSFNSEEIKTELFQKQLGLIPELGEVNYYLRELINEDDVRDSTTNDDLKAGRLSIIVISKTQSAFYGKKFLKPQESAPITQNIQNYQSNQGVIYGNQQIGDNIQSEGEKGLSLSRWQIILGIISIIVTILIAIFAN